MGTWNDELATIWTNNVPPSRPSYAEMRIYGRLLSRVRSKLGRRARLLILGSTPEFRDWGYSEDLDVTVVDKSESYYRAISREIRHKNAEERLVVSEWEDMRFDGEFDVVVGDLAIGNVDPSRFDSFLANVSAALASGGLFMGKSMFWQPGMADSPKSVADDYRKLRYRAHPYTLINHRLGLCCLNRDANVVRFADMYNLLCRMVDDRLLPREVLPYFERLGWNDGMIASFYAPSKEDFERRASPYFSSLEWFQTEDPYSFLFPVFAMEKTTRGE